MIQYNPYSTNYPLLARESESDLHQEKQFTTCRAPRSQGENRLPRRNTRSPGREVTLADVDALSSTFDDEDLIPILDREDSDLSYHESSRCSSSPVLLPEWVCPLKYSFTPYSRLLGNATRQLQLPRAPPPTPLPTSPSILPKYQNEENSLHLEVPAFSLGTGLKELGVCAAMGYPVCITKPWWSMTSAEEPHCCNIRRVFKVS